MKKLTYILLPLLTFLTSHIAAQKISIDKYDKAVFYLTDNLINKEVFNVNTDAYWHEDNSGLWFVDYSRNKKTFQEIKFSDYKITPLFNHKKLAKKLKTFAKDTEIDPSHLDITDVEKSNDTLKFNFVERQFILNLSNYKLSRVEKSSDPQTNRQESLSPNGLWRAYVKDYNLYIQNTADDIEYQLSEDGRSDFAYGSFIGWFDKTIGVDGERPNRFNVSWSPDSKFIFARVCDLTVAEKMHMLDYSQDDKFRPELVSYYRGSPGDSTVAYYHPVIYDINSKKVIKTELESTTHFSAAGISWGEESGDFWYRYPKRGFQEHYITRTNLLSRETETLITEKSKTNIDNFRYWPMSAVNKLVFLSERSGWSQIYLMDLNTKEIKPITNGDYYVVEILNIDEENEVIHFVASGKDSSINPYYYQCYKSNYSGDITLLTSEPIHHDINISRDNKYLVDNMGTIHQPTQTVLRDAHTGEILQYLTKADIADIKKMGWESPLSFDLIGKDDASKIYGALWKPTDFDPSKKYPIIDASYTGPHTQVYPKSFYGAFIEQSMAELGFIVMRVDGLGTAGRSKKFKDHSYKNMGNNLEDHVLAIEHLGKRFNWIDTTKVGIFGHSAGGYDAAHALLAFPKTYKVAVSSSADHDFRMEKAWWPEMYMGWPVDSTYHQVSNITMADKLEGKLLLAHGQMDDNVNVSATFKLAEALIKANKDFDLLILPSQRHGYRGEYRNYFRKKRWNYFIEHLLGLEPLWDINFDLK